MAVYFAKYGTAGRKDYQHHVPREWLTSVLVCDDCGLEYDQDRDECPDCGCLEAELVDIGGGPGRFWGYRRLRLVPSIRQVTPAIEPEHIEKLYSKMRAAANRRGEPGAVRRCGPAPHRGGRRAPFPTAHQRGRDVPRA